MWLRATKENGVEFIVSYKSKKYAWGTETINQTIETADGWRLTIKSFNKQKDSGIYNCATYNANALQFGRLTVIEGEQGGFILHSFLCVSFFYAFIIMLWYYNMLND